MSSSLQAELRQSKPFDSIETEAVLNIARTAALLEHGLAQALKPYRLTPTQYNVLRILRGGGPEGLCRNAIGERLVTPVPDVTRLLDRMEGSGLVTRSRGTEDRRFMTTKITQAGLELVAGLDEPMRLLSQKQLGHLSQSALRTLIETLTEARQRA